MVLILYIFITIQRPKKSKTYKKEVSVKKQINLYWTIFQQKN